MSTPSDDIPELRYAEYVLGVLDADARLAVEREALADASGWQAGRDRRHLRHGAHRDQARGGDRHDALERWRLTSLTPRE